MCTKLSENLSMWPKSWQAILIQILSQSPSTSLSFSRQVNKQTILTSAPGRATPNSAENNPKKILQPAEIYISTHSHTYTGVWQPTEVGPKWRKLHDGFATSVRRSFTADVQPAEQTTALAAARMRVVWTRGERGAARGAARIARGALLTKGSCDQLELANGCCFLFRVLWDN